MPVYTKPRHVVPVHATHFGGELRKLLKLLDYNPRAVADIVDAVGCHGTAAGSPVDSDDLDAVNALVMRYTGDEESDPADWPAWTDEGQWVPEDAVDAPGPDTLNRETVDEALNALPSRDGWAAPFSTFEPAPSDRIWWAQLTAGLEPFPQLRGGSPADHKPIRVAPARSRHERGQPNLTDSDILLHTGCVG